MMKPQSIYIGNTPQKQAEKAVEGSYVSLLGEPFYQIRNVDAMEPFFMSLVSSSDHWLFIASTGGISAGRVSAEQAIFPYYTVDKLTENHENTGHKAILIVHHAHRKSLWEPFSDHQRGSYDTERNLYKNVTGTALVFEENNLDLGLVYRYAWRTSETFGFVKTAWLINTGDMPCDVEMLDGIQNILPANVGMVTQNTFSSLLDAYKRSELDAETGLAIFALNSTLTDLAEPSESLLATTAVQVGLPGTGALLSSIQLDRFRAGKGVSTETEVRGQRGAYFVHRTIAMAAHEERSWHFMIDTGQDAAAVVEKISWLRGDPTSLRRAVEEDIAASQSRLWKIVAGADGVQLSSNPLLAAHHFANVMFNVMRGGIFADSYWMQAKDLTDFVSIRNQPALQAHPDFFASLPAKIHLAELLSRAEASGSEDLLRLAYAYLPLTFSRRHGDPSRPWNRFAINIRQPDGSLKLDYEGNWRDIFQNWEALAYAYPEFVESMISTFLNATTVDGYNPYRITHHGVDWEAPEPGNPWANIGYWSDHQIIYLQKLMEISAMFHPGKLQALLNRPLFSYANVPYRIKPYADLLEDPYNTIDFDWALEKQVEARVKECGADGKLVLAKDGQVLRASLAEKLLTLLLAKLANFVPEGGIWMNTQRPEWNDANNALVGKGLSVVTLCYLRRCIAFCLDLFKKNPPGAFAIHVEVQQFFQEVSEILNRYHTNLHGTFTDALRRNIMDDFGQAGSAYRWNFYNHGLSGENISLQSVEIVHFLEQAQQYIEHSLRANRRNDHLYHTYNILHLGHHYAAVGHLYEMLEGQVAILSSGLLQAEESLTLLESVRNSALYQASQNSYILYPDRDVPGFLEKNCISAEQVNGLALPHLLAEDREYSLITRDVHGGYHFSGGIRNIKDVNQALDALQRRPRYAHLVEAEADRIRVLFEDTFHHNAFTGRSSTFFAYEGLGSVYWHMAAKLLLTAQETALRFRDTACAPALLERYRDIRQGLGFNKPPAEFGAFPTDPYSHTPKGQGAKQPGMTGLVKEEILARQVELGYTVENGQVVFDLLLFSPAELLTAPSTFAYYNVTGQQVEMELETGSLAYTICQTPIILQAEGQPGITVYFADGSFQHMDGHVLDSVNSQHIFHRDGKVQHVWVSTGLGEPFETL
jgi:hypothetical protein